MVQGVTPAHKGLAPSRLIPYLRYDKDAHAGHTHCKKAIAGVVENQRLVHLFNFGSGGQGISLKSATALIFDRYAQ
jgi:hypothetical protein